jgi:hypothetical protein
MGLKYMKSFRLYESEQNANVESLNEANKGFSTGWADFEIKGKKLVVEFTDMDGWDTSSYGGGRGHAQAIKDIKMASKFENDILLDDIEQELESKGITDSINWDKAPKIVANGEGLEFVLESIDEVLQEGFGPDDYGNLYYEVAKKVLKSKRSKIHPARIENLLDKMFSDGFLKYDEGTTKKAEKDILQALDAVGKDAAIYINEGNEFSAARQKAIDNDEDEFEVDGETFKVTGKKDKGNKLEERNAFIWAKLQAEANGQKEFEFNGKQYKITKKDKVVNEAFVDLDTTEEGLNDKVFQAYLTKHKINHEIVNPNGPGGGHPEVRFTAKSAKILKNFIDEFYMDDYLYTFIEESVNEAYTKQSAIKAMGKSHDAILTTKSGDEYIIYNPDSGNDDNTATWKKDGVEGFPEGGGEGDEKLIKYSDIKSIKESINEGRDKLITKKTWDNLSDQEREEKLLTAFKDPDEAGEHIGDTWDQLPDVALANMYEAKALNEGSYEDFISDHGKEVKRLANEVYKLGAASNKGDIPEETFMGAFAYIEGIYDSEPVSMIDDMTFGGRKVSLKDIAEVAINMQNRHGTEMSQVVYCMEDFINKVKFPKRR